MKQAYARDCGSYHEWYPVRLTGLCKAVKGGTYGRERRFVQVRKMLFGISLWAYWVEEDDVKFFDPVVETIYKCECDK